MQYTHFRSEHMRDFLEERIHLLEREHYACYVAHESADETTDNGMIVRSQMAERCQLLERALGVVREKLAELPEPETETAVDEEPLATDKPTTYDATIPAT